MLTEEEEFFIDASNAGFSYEQICWLWDHYHGRMAKLEARIAIQESALMRMAEVLNSIRGDNTT